MDEQDQLDLWDVSRGWSRWVGGMVNDWVGE